MRPRSEQVEPDRIEPFSSPRCVDRVFGHDAALAEFQSALQADHLHHAWALVGPEGIGKATLSYALARMVLAHTEEDGQQRGTVADVPPTHSLFRQVARLSHPNLLLLRRSWVEKTKRYSQWIGVDDVRRLRAFLGSTAGNRAWRVVIVDRADQLNQNAANALLKALEEPPPRTLFLLVSNAEGRLPVTIRSRCRVLRLAALGDEPLTKAVRAALARDGIEVDETALPLAVALAEGSVRRALELLTGDGLELYDEIVATFAALPEIDGAVLHKRAERLSAAGESERLELYMALLLGLIERLVRSTATGETALDSEQTLATRFISTKNISSWASAWEAISEAMDEAFALNLDRTLLVLSTWFGLQQLVHEHPA